MVASLISDRLIRRLGTGWVTVLSTALTAGALLGFSLSHNLLWLCLFAVPLGLGAGAIDCALNNYVALHYRATHMNFLHCFYGIGVSLSPYLMSLALADAANWRKGYHIVFFFQLAITAVTLFCPAPMEAAAKRYHDAVPETQRLTFGEILKIPTVRLVWLIFFGSCAIEYVCGTWGSSYLVNAKGVAVDTAARIITFYYVGMALGRFLSGVLANRVPSWALIRWGQALVLVAIALLFLPSAPSGCRHKPVPNRAGQRAGIPQFAPSHAKELRRGQVPVHHGYPDGRTPHRYHVHAAALWPVGPAL